MKLGFTGTRTDVTGTQIIILNALLIEKHPTEFHHGDCVGADESAHKLTKHYGAKTICHPPDNDSQRAFTKNDYYHEPYPYLVRNKHIVDSCDEMIAMPGGPEMVRSGTWSTIRYAGKRGVPVTIIMPNGTVIFQGRDGERVEVNR